MTDPFALLGVPRKLDLKSADIDQLLLDASQLHHPDAGGDQNLFLNNSCQSILSPENKHYELFNDEGKLIFSLDTKTEVWEY